MAQIKIGQTAGFTGAAAAGVKEITDGAKLYLDSVNAEGGVNGQTIELVSMDDKFDPALAAESAKSFAGAKVLVAALRRSGKDITRSGIKKALETFNRVDIGGLEVSYSATDHTGLDCADLSMVAADGSFSR